MDDEKHPWKYYGYHLDLLSLGIAPHESDLGIPRRGVGRIRSDWLRERLLDPSPTQAVPASTANDANLEFQRHYGLHNRSMASGPVGANGHRRIARGMEPGLGIRATVWTRTVPRCG